MKPSDQQMAALVLAMSEGYIRPASATHARRCNTTSGRLSKTCQICERQGWMVQISGVRYKLTEAGEALIPSTATPVRSADDSRIPF